jgi:SAM-dependent methyltransferase
MIKLIKKFIVTNKYFWKYRHLINSNVWNGYYDSHNSVRRNYYSKIVKKMNIKSVFEFGCASGPNLRAIQKNSSQKIYVVGLDLNKSAIRLARENFIEDFSFFSDNADRDEIVEKLKEWRISSFNLAIYDRVLYLLNEKEIHNHFRDFSGLFDFVLIDDFHNPSFQDSNGIYTSKNYHKILSHHGFKLVSVEKSAHSMTDLFFENNAKRMILRSTKD